VAYFGESDDVISLSDAFDATLMLLRGVLELDAALGGLINNSAIIARRSHRLIERSKSSPALLMLMRS
jgi:hypothetical protein